MSKSYDTMEALITETFHSMKVGEQMCFHRDNNLVIDGKHEQSFDCFCKPFAIERTWNMTLVEFKRLYYQEIGH